MKKNIIVAALAALSLSSGYAIENRVVNNRVAQHPQTMRPVKATHYVSLSHGENRLAGCPFVEGPDNRIIQTLGEWREVCFKGDRVEGRLDKWQKISYVFDGSHWIDPEEISVAANRDNIVIARIFDFKFYRESPRTTYIDVVGIVMRPR